MSDIYSISCGSCGAHMGVCPGIQPMPSIYCPVCEPAIREEMMGGVGHAEAEADEGFHS
jgi:predicted nucleic acid-binding Zn ribbon protein